MRLHGPAVLWAASSLLSCGLGAAGLGPVSAGATDGALPGADAGYGDVVARDSDVPADDAPADGAATDASYADDDASRGLVEGGPTDARADTSSTSADSGDSAAPAGDAGPAATPGFVECASSPCAVSTSVCCVCPGCFPPFPTACTPSFPGCTTGYPLHCDDVTDCTGGDVCCATFSGSQLTGSTCQPSCTGASKAQLCDVDAECPRGETCKPYASIPGYSACQ